MTPGALNGKHAVVIGSSRGIGAAIARRFALEDATVSCAARSLEGAERVAAQLRGSGHKATSVGLDLREQSSIERGLRKATEAAGPIDVLVQSGGITSTTPFVDVEASEWRNVLGTNLDGTFYACQFVARQLLRRKAAGSVIVVTSQLSQVAIPNKAPYLASKGGMTMLVKAMALDLAAHGIRVNALAPGVTETDMAMSRLSADSEAMEWTRRRIPMGRLADPDEMGGAAVFLASDESAYVTGTTIFVDGGYLAQ